MNILKRLFQILTLLIGTYILVVIVHGSFNDYQPKEQIKLSIEGQATHPIIVDSVIRFINWNIGYGGLGETATFFYDDGRMFFSGKKMVKSPKKAVQKNVDAFVNFIQLTKADIYLFQEVDIAAKRSYYINQYETFGKVLNNFSRTFAMNYNVKRVPLPIFEFWNVMGKVQSGLATYTKYQPIATTRYQFPGNYSWPMKIFQLDRCFALHRFKTAKGKELIVINTHNSAYDKGGVLKKQQMMYLKNILLAEYKKGNYIIVGGDWNQCPPNFDISNLYVTQRNPWKPIFIKTDYLSPEWLWVYDPTAPTNRSLANPYESGQTPTNLIDFYLISPNVQLIKVKTIQQEFQFSDHQPVYMEVKLR